MEPISSSPVPLRVNKPSLLSFPDALKEIINGHKITRASWESKEEYGFMGKDGYLSIHTKGVDHQWLVNDGDLLAEDWLVIGEGN